MAECSVMIALSAVLSFIPVFKAPFGGSVTLLSQLPPVILSYRYGVKTGMRAGLVLAVIQLIIGLGNFSYVNGIGQYAILAFFDYIAAFSCLGAGGFFRKVFSKQTPALVCAGAFVSLIRFVCHFISGVTIWSGYAEDTPVVIYSLTYNGSYMIPELIMTVIGALVLGSLLDFSGDVIKPLKKKGKTE